MGQVNTIKLKNLRQTRSFYIWQLKRGGSLTPNEYSKYLGALETIEKIIKEKEDCEGRGRYKKEGGNN